MSACLQIYPCKNNVCILCPHLQTHFADIQIRIIACENNYTNVYLYIIKKQKGIKNAT